MIVAKGRSLSEVRHGEYRRARSRETRRGSYGPSHNQITMRAEIRAIESPDVHDLPTYAPEHPEHFGFMLRLYVGPMDGPGEESFDIQVCTPKWLTHRYGEDATINGRHHLIVFKYQWTAIEDFVREFVASCSGDTWREIASKLSRLGYWEFEDYRELTAADFE
jgi:hypothetical protein